MKFNQTFSVLFWLYKTNRTIKAKLLSMYELLSRVSVRNSQPKDPLHQIIGNHKDEKALASHPEFRSLNEYLALVRAEINKRYNILLSIKE